MKISYLHIKSPERYLLAIFIMVFCSDAISQDSQYEYDSATVYVDEIKAPLNFSTDSLQIVNIRTVPDTIVTRFQHDKDFNYANDASYWVKTAEKSRPGFWDSLFNFFAGDFMRLILYLALIATAVFVIYRIIAVNNLFVFSSRRKNTEAETKESAVLDRDQLENKLKEAINVKNYRSAIRYLYLKTLHFMDQQGLIIFDPQATNQQYIDRLKDHSKIRDFRFLTQVYEYVWYGEFELNEYQFDIAAKSFSNFENDLKS